MFMGTMKTVTSLWQFPGCSSEGTEKNQAEMVVLLKLVVHEAIEKPNKFSSEK